MTYSFVYDGSSRPKWEQNLVAQSGETLVIPLVFENDQQRLELTVEQVYQHIDNLIQYIKDKSSQISSIKMDEETPADGWHFKGGWGEVEWAKDEAFKWWDWAYHNDDFEASSNEEPESV